MKYIVSILVCLVLLACCKNEEIVEPMEDPNDDPMVDSDTLRVLWQSLLVPSDSSQANAWKGAAYNDKFVYLSYDEFENGSINPNVYKFDALTGNYLGPWDKFLYDDNISYSNNKMVALEDYLVIESLRSMYLVDYETDEILHSEYFDHTSRVTEDMNLLFATNSYNPESFAELVYKDLNAPIGWKTLFNKSNEDGYEDRFLLASADINSEGDTIVYMIQAGYNFIVGDERTSLRAYNFSKKEEVWHADDIEPHGTASLQNSLVIDGDRLYFCGGTRIHCLNRHTGEYIWKRDFQQPEFFGNTNYFIIEDKMYFQSSLGNQFFLDKYNGDILFKKDFPGSADNLAYGNGYIIFITGKIYVLDDQTGEVLYQFESPYFKGSFVGHVSYDSENNRLYAEDGYFLYALELPEK